MSGDVQPRKRKDKKRKKEDSTEQIPSQPQTPPSNNQTEDLLNIHVHKEDGTGGGICAKIIFFFLFSALALLIGLIITEHRGLTDLDTVDQESRFSQLFEGWIDNSVSHDDEGDHIVSSLEEDDHGEDENESPETHLDDEHDEEEHDEEEEPSEEAKSEEDEEEEQDEDEEAQDVDEDEDEDEEEDDTGEDETQTLESEEQDDESDQVDADEDEASNENEDEEQDVSKDDDDEIEGADDDDDADEDDNASKPDSEEENVIEQSEEKESEELKEEEEDEEVADKEEADEEENEDAVAEEKEDEEQGEGAEDQNNSKSVNVRPDNEPEESDSDKQSDVDTYDYENITNKADSKIKDKIDEAQKNIKNNTAYALKLFDLLLQNNPSSPRCIYGKAQALDELADQKRSNDLLQKAISFYLYVLDLEDVPDTLFQAAAERCINRMRFIGNHNRAVGVHKKLIARFPEDVKHRNQLVVSYLTINRVNKARSVLEETLSKHPYDGFALVHYGFILKTADNKLNESVSYFKKGIATKAPGVIDGRFYFHLGDALARLGKKEEATKVYEEAVQHKLFLSKYQRSLYNVERLKGQPWWKKAETPYANLYTSLESNWKKIRDEGFSVLSKNGLFENESENLKDTGDWKQFELFARGQKNIANCKKCPITCRIIESIPDAKGCRRGQTKFSVMHPGTHVWPHCGPTNCRLRVHLGLNVPEHTYIRVADETRSWENGKVIIFDDSFEHEVWHNGTTFRLVLIVDVWHPELTSAEKRTLSPI